MQVPFTRQCYTKIKNKNVCILLHILHRPSDTVQMVFFFMIFVLILHVCFINLLNSVVKIVANLLFKSIHQLGAICYLYTPCRHLNITMFSDTQANYCFGRPDAS